MSQPYIKEKYEKHDIIFSAPPPRSLSIPKLPFTLCDIVTPKQDKRHPPSSNLIDEAYLQALKLHQNPRSFSAAPAKPARPQKIEKSQTKYTLSELKIMKKKIQEKKRKIEKQKKLKSENLAKIQEAEKKNLEAESRNNFLQWVQDKIRQKKELQKKKLEKEQKSSQIAEQKSQQKLEQKFKTLEERQKRLSKLKQDPCSKPDLAENNDFPTILAYSTSKQIKTGKF